MARPRRPRRSPLRISLAVLLAAASTVSANLLTLNDFQRVTTNSISVGCLIAYNKFLIGCESSDFQDGATCSKDCVGSLEDVEDDIQDACKGIQVSSTSVMANALNGDLVDFLCPENNKPSAIISSVVSNPTNFFGPPGGWPQPSNTKTGATPTSTPVAPVSSGIPTSVIPPTPTPTSSDDDGDNNDRDRDNESGGGSILDLEPFGDDAAGLAGWMGARLAVGVAIVAGLALAG